MNCFKFKKWVVVFVVVFCLLFVLWIVEVVGFGKFIVLFGFGQFLWVEFEIGVNCDEFFGMIVCFVLQDVFCQVGVDFVLVLFDFCFVIEK